MKKKSLSKKKYEVMISFFATNFKTNLISKMKKAVKF